MLSFTQSSPRDSHTRKHHLLFLGLSVVSCVKVYSVLIGRHLQSSISIDIIGVGKSPYAGIGFKLMLGL